MISYVAAILREMLSASSRCFCVRFLRVDVAHKNATNFVRSAQFLEKLFFSFRQIKKIYGVYNNKTVFFYLGVYLFIFQHAMISTN